MHQERYITFLSNRHGAASPSHPRKDALYATSLSALTTRALLLPMAAIPDRCLNHEKNIMGER